MSTLDRLTHSNFEMLILLNIRPKKTSRPPLKDVWLYLTIREPITQKSHKVIIIGHHSLSVPLTSSLLHRGSMKEQLYQTSINCSWGEAYGHDRSSRLVATLEKPGVHDLKASRPKYRPPLISPNLLFTGNICT